ncbi:hypothetical protein ACFOD8_15530, partial [Arthrobacter agilis]|uniref:hypothetical protein n=1 Tax=Arthrobacter agilis TaxID=37921 RepID=UPI003618156F
TGWLRSTSYGVLSSMARLLGSPLGGLISPPAGFDAIVYANAATFLAGRRRLLDGARTRTRSTNWHPSLPGRPAVDRTSSRASASRPETPP